MAEAHVQTVFSTIQGLDVIVRRCLEGFGFWKRIKGSSASAMKIRTQLDMQCARLTNWAQEWGIATNNHRKNPLFCIYEPAVIGHFQQIHSILSDFHGLDTPGSVFTQTRSFVSMDILPRMDQFHASSGSYGEVSQAPTSFSSMNGIEWALQEDERKDDLALLTKLVDELHEILPPPRHDPAGTLILSDSLTTQDPNELEMISRVENSNPAYAALAWIKSVGYLPYGAHLQARNLHWSHLVPMNRKKDDTKFLAHYEDELVLVEEKSCKASWSEQKQLSILKARIDSVVARLQSPDKPTDLRTLTCMGGAFTTGKVTGEGSTWIYNIVYRADYSRFTTLGDILQDRKNRKKARFPLEKRFVLARILSRALMYLHLVDWLHKAIRSENVLFFINDENVVQSDSPYLIGFEYSRLDRANEETENVEEKGYHRLYRHPKATAVPIADFQQPLGGPGRYTKVYDIYSLGVVLIEIGLFMTPREMMERHKASEEKPLEEIREIFIEKIIPDLRFAMGDMYADAALTCINGSLESLSGQSLHQEFYRKVVCQLGLGLIPQS